jgi:hypothetical protein
MPVGLNNALGDSGRDLAAGGIAVVCRGGKRKQVGICLSVILTGLNERVKLQGFYTLQSFKPTGRAPWVRCLIPESVA